jgi:hypothetical protein
VEPVGPVPKTAPAVRVGYQHAARRRSRGRSSGCAGIHVWFAGWWTRPMPAAGS